MKFITFFYLKSVFVLSAQFGAVQTAVFFLVLLYNGNAVGSGNGNRDLAAALLCVDRDIAVGRGVGAADKFQTAQMRRDRYLAASRLKDLDA